MYGASSNLLRLFDILDLLHNQLLVLALDGFNGVSCTELPEILCAASTVMGDAKRHGATSVYFLGQIAEQPY